MARSPLGVSSSNDLQGFSDTRRASLAKTSSFWMHGAHILPRTGVFPVRGPFGNTSEHNLAIARHPGTHFASILPPPNSREHVADMCAYLAVSVHAAAAEEPGGTAASGPRGGCGGRGTAGGTARGGRGGRGAALARRPLSTETAGRRHALRRGGTAAAGGRSHGMEPARTCAATGRSRRRWRARLRDAPIGGGQHQLRGQLRHEGANEPVHSNIFPLRYSYQNYLLCNK